MTLYRNTAMLYRRVPCEHGEMEAHRAPYEDSYFGSYWCNGPSYEPVEEPVYKPTLCTSKWGHRIGKGNACKVKGCGAVWTERWVVEIGGAR